ncbi:hypothetical protein M0R45_031359 [Rubus argutus]|uniref:Uncharacterized protein n=1 Tax=Rubus argutus TaxID=59490 RepID=A0AAW1WHY5_RUBAR
MNTGLWVAWAVVDLIGLMKWNGDGQREIGGAALQVLETEEARAHGGERGSHLTTSSLLHPNPTPSCVATNQSSAPGDPFSTLCRCSPHHPAADETSRFHREITDPIAQSWALFLAASLSIAVPALPSHGRTSPSDAEPFSSAGVPQSLQLNHCATPIRPLFPSLLLQDHHSLPQRTPHLPSSVSALKSEEPTTGWRPKEEETSHGLGKNSERKRTKK